MQKYIVKEIAKEIKSYEIEAENLEGAMEDIDNWVLLPESEVVESEIISISLM